MTDKELIEMACDKLIGKEILISGICGDVERGKILQFKELQDVFGRKRLTFITSNEEYEVIGYYEDEIINMEKDKVKLIDRLKKVFNR